jgi:hypothetical protein
MESLLKTFSFTQEEYENYNKLSTEHVKSYYDKSMDNDFIRLFKYLDGLDDTLPEYCEFGADKCRVSNFQNFCDKLNVDILENITRMIQEHHNIFENKHEILRSPGTFYQMLEGRNAYNFYSRDKKFMFTCTSPLFMGGSLAYFGCTGEQKYIIKAFEIIYDDGNRDLCYGGRDYA